MNLLFLLLDLPGPVRLVSRVAGRGGRPAESHPGPVAALLAAEEPKVEKPAAPLVLASPIPVEFQCSCVSRC